VSRVDASNDCFVRFKQLFEQRNGKRAGIQSDHNARKARRIASFVHKRLKRKDISKTNKQTISKAKRKNK
jgi:hypothetical protein